MSVDLVSDRFNPARNSVVFSVFGDPDPPLSDAAKRSYLKELHAITAGKLYAGDDSEGMTWRKFTETATPEFDADGQVVLQASEGESIVEVGVTRRNLQTSDLQNEDAPLELQRELVVSRLKQTLARSRAPRISSTELREDWQLLQKIDLAEQEKTTKTPARRIQAVSQRSQQSSD